MMHIDDGVLSVASERILHDLAISESQLGLIEASLYVGFIIGSLVCPFLFGRISTKALIVSAVLLNAAAVGSWAATDIYWVLATCRVLNGIFLVSESLICRRLIYCDPTSKPKFRQYSQCK
jgi:MFS family permease